MAEKKTSKSKEKTPQTLVIVESPTKAHTIEKYLTGDGRIDLMKVRRSGIGDDLGQGCLTNSRWPIEND